MEVEKKHINNEAELIFQLSKQLGRIIRNNYQFFLNYDVIKVYYDNGQKQLSKVLITVLAALVDKPVFRMVKPQDYSLFQVADYLSTLELINKKYKGKIISNSEKYFFGEHRFFYRNYYRKIIDKKIS